MTKISKEEEKRELKKLEKVWKKAKAEKKVIDALEVLKTGSLTDLDIMAIKHVIGLVSGVKTHTIDKKEFKSEIPEY